MANEQPVVSGLEACLADPPELLRRTRFGLLMNQASVNREGEAAHYLMANAFPGWLTALFSPQHGLWGKQQANMIETPTSYHLELDLPVYSLYSETRKPTEQMLREIDCLVIDLQDVESARAAQWLAEGSGLDVANRIGELTRHGIQVPPPDTPAVQRVLALGKADGG